MSKLLLLFLVMMGLASGALIGMNVHEVNKDNLDKGDTAISIINIIIGGVMFFIGLAMLFFLQKPASAMIAPPAPAPAPLVSAPPAPTTVFTPPAKPAIKKRAKMTVPSDLNLSEIPT